MTADFKRFAPSKDATITITRKLTIAERKAKQLKDFTAAVVDELFYLHNYKQLDRVLITRHTDVYEFKFVDDRVTVNNTSLFGGFIIQNATSAALKKELLASFDIFDICDIARLLKRAHKQVNDKLALKGNKPQPKVVKQKIVKKSDLEMFAEEFKQLRAKYPDVKVHGGHNGNIFARADNPYDMFRVDVINL